MAKTALVRWSESLAAALKDEGITANVVQPSTIDHPVSRREMPKADPSKWVSPDELASVILFLTSREASAVTGAAIPVVGRV
jgi:NAD(P)-dependent dehydrogenase (short-subunit alcohol dehydrogenase family)